jgi:hypothetical protein
LRRRPRHRARVVDLILHARGRWDEATAAYLKE